MPVLCLCAQGGQVVAARQVIDVRAQRCPVACRLGAVIPFGHHLVDAPRAVHDLLHLCFGLKIIRRWIKLTPQTVGRAIQIIHGVVKVVFCLLGLVPPPLRVCTLSARGRRAVLRRCGPVLGVIAAVVKILLEFINAVFYFTDSVGHLSLCKRPLREEHRGKAESGKYNCE